MSQREILASIIALTAYYGQKLEDHVVRMYAEDLADLPIESLRNAFQEIRRDPKVTRFPLPAQIRAKIQPTDTEDGEAADAAARIVEAVSRYGNSNHEKAKAFIGPLGWLVVQRDGGWLNVCQTLDHENMGTLKAQWRNMALTLSKRAKFGMVEIPGAPKIEHQPGGLQQLGSFMPRSLPKEAE